MSSILGSKLCFPLVFHVHYFTSLLSIPSFTRTVKALITKYMNYQTFYLTILIYPTLFIFCTFPLKLLLHVTINQTLLLRFQDVLQYNSIPHIPTLHPIISKYLFYTWLYNPASLFSAPKLSKFNFRLSGSPLLACSAFLPRKSMWQ